MPLKLIPPIPGKTPYWYVRGTLLGIRLHRSTGVNQQKEARVVLKRWRAEILSGRYSYGVSSAAEVGPTFMAASRAYMEAGGEVAFLASILAWRGDGAIHALALADVDQLAIDRLAAVMYPAATAATRNRQVYTPISAVLKRAGIERQIKRPKGWRGGKSVSWLEPEQAFALFEAADARGAEFGLFCRLLCYTGMRLGEALAVQVGDVNLARAAIYLPRTKSGEPRTVHLPPVLVAALANHPRGLDRSGRLIRYHAGGRLRDMLIAAMESAGLSFPRRQGGFHLFRHTWAAWMRRYGGLDTSALVATQAWRDRTMAARYEHADASEEARKADLLPVQKAADILPTVQRRSQKV